MSHFLRRYRLTVALPVIWMVCSLISFEHPGDEYALYFISSFFGTWIAFVFEPGDVHELWLRGSITLAGGVLIAGLGFLLDRLRLAVTIGVLAWLTLAAFFLYSFVAPYEQMASALEKNGSWTAYVSASSNLGLSFATLVCLFGALLQRAFRKRDTQS